MTIDHVYERDNVYVVFDGPQGIGWHHRKDSPEADEVAAYLLDHPEALIEEPRPPEPTAGEIKARRIAEINARIKELDAQSISYIRAFQIGKQTANDIVELEKIDSESKALKAELKA